jgi:hypothetical protein
MATFTARRKAAALLEDLIPSLIGNLGTTMNEVYEIRMSWEEERQVADWMGKLAEPFMERMSRIRGPFSFDD